MPISGRKSLKYFNSIIPDVQIQAQHDRVWRAFMYEISLSQVPFCTVCPHNYQSTDVRLAYWALSSNIKLMALTAHSHSFGEPGRLASSTCTTAASISAICFAKPPQSHVLRLEDLCSDSQVKFLLAHVAR